PDPLFGETDALVASVAVHASASPSPVRSNRPAVLIGWTKPSGVGALYVTLLRKPTLLETANGNTELVRGLYVPVPSLRNAPHVFAWYCVYTPSLGLSPSMSTGPCWPATGLDVSEESPLSASSDSGW